MEKEKEKGRGEFEGNVFRREREKNVGTNLAGIWQVATSFIIELHKLEIKFMLTTLFNFEVDLNGLLFKLKTS